MEEKHNNPIGLDKNNQPVFEGDTLLIVAGKSDRFNGSYGKAKAMVDGRVLVVFPKEFASHFCGVVEEHKRVALFDFAELTKFDLSHHPELRAKALYGIRNYYHVAKLPEPFSPKNICAYAGCKNHASQRILFNKDGIVMEYDVCQEHLHLDGGCGNVALGAPVHVLENIHQEK